VFPSGIGARDIILIAALTPVLPHTAVAVALLTRVVTTASDLACGGLGLALGRIVRSTAQASVLAGESQPAHRSRGRHRKPRDESGLTERVPAA
jgi:hypothetical protein